MGTLIFQKCKLLVFFGGSDTIYMYIEVVFTEELEKIGFKKFQIFFRRKFCGRKKKPMMFLRFFENITKID